LPLESFRNVQELQMLQVCKKLRVKLPVATKMANSFREKSYLWIIQLMD